jgi:MoaA/NifB/PqqE/SkfB family radical SAM enzyme
MTPLSILFRGYLESCNYDCAYCPFAKREDDREARARDRASLERFIAWAGAFRPRRLAVLFTPWGEALVRAWYRDAVVSLSRMEHVERVAAQTNLSGPLAFLEECDVTRVALWCTYHPTEVARARFVGRCEELARRGVRFSVGVVGQREHASEIEALRRELPAGTYLWINAVRSLVGRYTREELDLFASIDPLFGHNLRPPPSRGAPCRAGESVISVDGAGDVRRCHFVSEVIGNLYAPGWESALAPRACPNAACRCHIGYVHRRDLPLYAAFEGGVLERIPRALTSR